MYSKHIYMDESTCTHTLSGRGWRRKKRFIDLEGPAQENERILKPTFREPGIQALDAII